MYALDTEGLNFYFYFFLNREIIHSPSDTSPENIPPKQNSWKSFIICGHIKYMLERLK